MYYLCLRLPLDQLRTMHAVSTVDANWTMNYMELVVDGLRIERLMPAGRGTCKLGNPNVAANTTMSLSQAMWSWDCNS